MKGDDVLEELSKQVKKKTRAAVLLGFLPLEVSTMIGKELNTSEKELLVREILAMPSYNTNVVELVVNEALLFIESEEYVEMNLHAEFSTAQQKETKELAVKVREAVEKNPSKTVDYIKKLIHEE